MATAWLWVTPVPPPPLRPETKWPSKLQIAPLVRLLNPAEALSLSFLISVPPAVFSWVSVSGGRGIYGVIYEQPMSRL